MVNLRGGTCRSEHFRGSCEKMEDSCFWTCMLEGGSSLLYAVRVHKYTIKVTAVAM